MILTDTGPIVALINRNDPNHTACLKATKQLSAGHLITTWPCFTEAMYLLYEAGGYTAQESLWRLRSIGRLVLHDMSVSDTDRMAELMSKYRDIPMDMADASIIVAAEYLKMKLVFTLDSDFYIYRLKNGSALEVVP